MAVNQKIVARLASTMTTKDALTDLFWSNQPTNDVITSEIISNFLTNIYGSRETRVILILLFTLINFTVQHKALRRDYCWRSNNLETSFSNLVWPRTGRSVRDWRRPWSAILIPRIR
jgi:hypothetical protein